jgi:hypothetical protein
MGPELQDSLRSYVFGFIAGLRRLDHVDQAAGVGTAASL